MTHCPELLAPAGGFDAACAAFLYGADAVYLGLPRFSARAEAENFTSGDLRKIIGYARSFSVPKKVYITLNTLIFEKEREALLESLALLDELEADGVIVQDLGLAGILRRYFPKIPLHASTQLACHSTAGAKALKDFGFTRVVTARELSLDEAAAIGKNAGIEVEVFIHGALCYSYSGLCLFSALATGRSGNRGRCAYCCRDEFTPLDKNGRPLQADSRSHPFSMRDLSTLSEIEALCQPGIVSLKIEGRMKNPLYVAAVTDLYRHALDRSLSPDALEVKAADLHTIFSRPWTPLYTRDRQTPPEAVIDPVAVGHRGQPIGCIRNVFSDASGTRWLRFDSNRPLEKHDGIQVELSSGGRPFGFPVDAMRRPKTNRLLTTCSGGPVEIALPKDAPVLPPRTPVFCSASQAVRRAFPVNHPPAVQCRLLRPVDIHLTFTFEALTAKATLPDGTSVVQTLSVALSPARSPEQTGDAVRRAFQRMGDDGFRLEKLTLDDPANLYSPPSLLNSLRRQLTEALKEKAETDRQFRLQSLRQTLVREIPVTADAPDLPPRIHLRLSPDAPRSFVRQIRPASLVLACAANTTMDDLRLWFEIGEELGANALRFALPVIIRDHEKSGVQALVLELFARGCRKFEVPDLAGLFFLKEMLPAGEELDISSDWTWYAFNTDAVSIQQACGLNSCVTSPEDTLSNLILTAPVRKAAFPVCEVLVYQYTPVFISETRPLVPTGTVTLVNRKTSRYFSVYRQQRWITLSFRPWSILEHLSELRSAGYTDFRIDISWVPPEYQQDLFSGNNFSALFS